MPVPHIPSDVIEIILDQARQDERGALTLAACCLVSTTFRRPPRQRLYRKLLGFCPSKDNQDTANINILRLVTLELEPGQADLLSSLVGDPALAALPRTLVLFALLKGDVVTNSDASSTVLATVLWLCPNVSSLALRAEWVGLDGFASLARTIIDLRPTLTRLDLMFTNLAAPSAKPWQPSSALSHISTPASTTRHWPPRTSSSPSLSNSEPFESS